MIITRIAKRRNKQRLYAVDIDGSFALDVSDAVLLKFGLRKDNPIDEEMIAAIKAAECEREAQLTAVNYVSYRPRSSREVLDHLIRKGFPKEVSESVVQHLQSASLINDFEFARMYVRDKLLRKPTGQALLRRQLMSKGISSSMTAQVLAEYISDDDQKKAAQELGSKRLRLTKQSTAKLDPVKQKQRLTGYLLRHGFSNDIVQKTIQALFNQ